MRMIDHEIAQLIASVQWNVTGPRTEAAVIEAVNRLGPLHPARYLGGRGLAPGMCAAMERPSAHYDVGGKDSGAEHGEVWNSPFPSDRYTIYG